SERDCIARGGLWQISCDEYIPPKEYMVGVTKETTDDIVGKANAQKYSGIAKKYPDYSIQNMVDAIKKYTPVYENGSIKNYTCELEFKKGPLGGESNLHSAKPLVTPTNSVITTQPIQFQLINYSAPEKIKTETRDPRLAQGTISKISLAEKKSDASMGIAGFEDPKAHTTIVQGELVASIQKDGLIGEGLVISFVSGSNIKLDTNEAKNIIRISLDDLHFNEIVNVSDDVVRHAVQGDTLVYSSSGTTGEWIISSEQPVGPVGNDTDITNIPNNAIIYNEGGVAGGTSDFARSRPVFSEIVGITASANFNSGITVGGSVVVQGNIREPLLKDTSETLEENASAPAAIFDFEKGNKHTVSSNTSGETEPNCNIMLHNPPPAGQAGIMTVYITNGAGWVYNECLFCNGCAAVGYTDTILWADGVEPTLSSGLDILTFLTVDGGSTYYGFVGGIDFS
ncbi:MAG: hypothetical protein QF704_12050, partial [Anaerolineales bacterium]|nr:hypothetical protein [Anaerolineales bacterium]